MSCSKTSCGHMKDGNGHCSVVLCPNYWNDCDDHGASSKRKS